MIVIVYHTYLVGNWKEVVKGQLDRLFNSGVYDVADKIYMTVNKENTPEEEVLKLINEYSKIEIEFFEKNYAEYPGIKKVKEIGDTFDNAKILYFHSKGVSNNYKVFNTKEVSEEKIENVKSWKECMEYFVIDKWKECIELLNEYDNVGMSCNGGWYWGNFWWTKSEHVKKAEEVQIWGRWDYEAWLNRNTPNSKNYEFYHVGFNLYLTKLTPAMYKGELSKYRGKKIIVKRAVYGTPPFEIDEGYSTMPTNVVEDVTDIVKGLVESTGGIRLDFIADNDNMGGDPIWGHRKCLIVELYPEGHPEELLKLGVAENHGLNFVF